MQLIITQPNKSRPRRLHAGLSSNIFPFHALVNRSLNLSKTLIPNLSSRDCALNNTYSLWSSKKMDSEITPRGQSMELSYLESIGNSFRFLIILETRKPISARLCWRAIFEQCPLFCWGDILEDCAKPGHLLWM